MVKREPLFKQTRSKISEVPHEPKGYKWSWNFQETPPKKCETVFTLDYLSSWILTDRGTYSNTLLKNECWEKWKGENKDGTQKTTSKKIKFLKIQKKSTDEKSEMMWLENKEGWQQTGSENLNEACHKTHKTNITNMEMENDTLHILWNA